MVGALLWCQRLVLLWATSHAVASAVKLTTDTAAYSPQHSKCEPVRSPVERT